MSGYDLMFFGCLAGMILLIAGYAAARIIIVKKKKELKETREI